ncbi:MAG TPA: T9SS type A sorting domain-containing protein [Bacteroidota bacterium]|nr:T9SS type A sorting domain-containing protein [Bacteroidota bacterium]
MAPPHAALHPNYPNPFNPGTTIRFELATSAMVRLSLPDILGREVALLVSEKNARGGYDIPFEASGLSSGVYFCRIAAGELVQVRRMIVVR